ncbi:MAG: hypothetical protein R6V19_03010 [Armatimonadota bacterium]
MDPRVETFINEHAGNLVGLDIALFFQANPQTFDTAAGIAKRTHRNVEEVKAALQRLADAELLEAFGGGQGRSTCFSLLKNPENWNLLCLLSEAYVDDLEQRKEIVRLIMKSHLRSRGHAEQPPARGCDQ